MLPAMPLRTYTAIDSDSEKGEHEGFLDHLISDDNSQGHARNSRWLPSSRTLAVVPWVLTAAFAALSLFLLFKEGGLANRYGSYEAGFITDLSRLSLQFYCFRSHVA